MDATKKSTRRETTRPKTMLEKTASMIQEVTAANMEQKTGANQVNSAITQLNQVTQQNAFASEELAENAREMNNQAEQLKELICYPFLCLFKPLTLIVS